jgi:hypothetical protein
VQIYQFYFVCDLFLLIHFVLKLYCRYLHFQKQKNKIMGMNKNTVLAWATFIMIIMGIILIGLGIYRYADVAGWGFATVGIGFLAIAWVFNALKGRV